MLWQGTKVSLIGQAKQGRAAGSVRCGVIGLVCQLTITIGEGRGREL